MKTTATSRGNQPSEPPDRQKPGRKQPLARKSCPDGRHGPASRTASTSLAGGGASATPPFHPVTFPQFLSSDNSVFQKREFAAVPITPYCKPSDACQNQIHDPTKPHDSQKPDKPAVFCPFLPEKTAAKQRPAADTHLPRNISVPDEQPRSTHAHHLASFMLV